MANSARNRDKDGAFAIKDEILLGVLTAVEHDKNVSQRHISTELGVALGLTNAYLRRCVRKGLIKIQQVPRRRYVYYLTPRGFMEKTRLTGQYLSASFNFFRRARDEMSALLAECAANGHRRIAFAGVSDLAEVGQLCAYDHPVKLVTIIDPERAGSKFYGIPVHATLGECGEIDVVIVTSLTESGAVFKAMEQQFEGGRVIVPRLLQHSLARNAACVATSQAAE
ncbi:MAG: winged helix-turn-helix transcriptional regulator [Pseudorhodoplanes sp.]|nr:MAG: winged helix-turn-helix transcriptional regulator [Pseudorhodoplanes sp.]